MFYLNSDSFSWGYVFVSAGLVTLYFGLLGGKKLQLDFVL
jgi:hypothetical protein